MEEGGIQGSKDTLKFTAMEKFLINANDALFERLRVSELNLRDANLNMEPKPNMDMIHLQLEAAQLQSAQLEAAQLQSAQLHLQLEAAQLQSAQLEQENKTLREKLYVTEAGMASAKQLLTQMVDNWEENKTLRERLFVTEGRLATGDKLLAQMVEHCKQGHKD
jgi:DNA-binding transcriptional regulator YiaG